MTRLGFDYHRVIVFGGTTEGRLIADQLDKLGKLVCVCVATEYGETFLENADMVRVGRMDMGQMIELFAEEKPSIVVDATHPYAVDVTRNIREACKNTGYPYMRVGRDRGVKSDETQVSPYLFRSLEEIISWLERQDGIIFSTLGAKEVQALTLVQDYQTRVYVRVLPVESSLAICDAAGFDRGHVIDAMGPFTYEQNCRMFRAVEANILLTKDSGRAGGFTEKIEAARDCGMKVAILTRPEEDEEGNVFSVEAILADIQREMR